VTPCTVWAGAVQSRGYGSMTNGRGGTMLAHRAAYEAARGPIPGDLTIDHLCRNKLCVNPDHLEVVTRGENSRRGAAAQRLCKNGHPLSGENLRVAVRARGVQRECRECHRAALRARRARLPLTTSTADGSPRSRPRSGGGATA
jgi:hypothetical protein